jgi:hypothetical protein
MLWRPAGPTTRHCAGCNADWIAPLAKHHDPHHDHSYKRLFAHPEMVRDLLLGFVPDPWVAEADLGSLSPVSGSFVTWLRPCSSSSTPATRRLGCACTSG